MIRSMGSHRLLRPRRIFFDTGHLVEMSRLQQTGAASPTLSTASVEAYRVLRRSFALGLIHPVIGFSQPFEWISNDVANGRQIAQVLDSAQSCFEVVDHSYVFILEAFAEAVRVGSGAPVHIPPILHNIRAEDAVCRFIGDRLGWQRLPGDGVRKFQNVRAMVDVCAEAKRLGSPPDDVDVWWFTAGFDETRSRINYEKTHARAATIERLRRLEILAALLATIHPNVEPDHLWSNIDFARCPCLSLWSGFWWRMVNNQSKADRTDPVDVSLLPVYCYSDLALTERRMCHHVVEADRAMESRVFAKPEQLVEALGLPPEGI